MSKVHALENKSKRFINVRNINLIESIPRRHLTASKSSVLEKMASFARDDGSCIYPSIKLISQLTKLNESTVTRAIKFLVQGGYLIKVKEAYHTRPAEYRLNIIFIQKLHAPCTPTSALGVAECHPDKVLTNTTSTQSIITKKYGRTIRTTSTNPAREELENLQRNTARLDKVEQVTVQCSVVNKVYEDVMSRALKAREPSAVFLKDVGNREPAAANRKPEDANASIALSVLRIVTALRGKISPEKVSELIHCYGLPRTESAVCYVKNMDIDKFYNLAGYLNRVIVQGYGEKKTPPAGQNRPSVGHHSLGDGSQSVNTTLPGDSQFNDIHTIRDRSTWSVEENRRWFMGLSEEGRGHVVDDVLGKWPALTHMAAHERCDIRSPAFGTQGLFVGFSDVINELRFDSMAKHLRSRI